MGKECTMPEGLKMTPEQMAHAAEIMRAGRLKVLLPDD